MRTPHLDVSDRPFIVIWETTTACPLACRHCRAEAHPQRDPDELSTSEATELMRQVASFGRPAPLFVITGGDPFQRPDLFALVRAGTQAGLRVAVSPSGTPTLTAANLAALHAAGAVALSLSLDGSTPAIHDSFRGVPGVYQWTVAAWQAARELGLKVQVNTTVSGHNLLDLPDIVQLVHTYGAMTWSAFLLVPTGRGRALAQLTPAQVEDVLNFVYDAGAVVPAKTTEAHHFRRVVIQRRILEAHGEDHVRALGLGPLYQRLRLRLRELGLDTGLRRDGAAAPGTAANGGARRSRRPPMDVNAGRGFVFIARDGTVYPSGFLPHAAGNVRQQQLTSIYRDSPLLAGLRDADLLGGRCGSCEFRTVCGGSRSRAYAMTGDPQAAEPWCGYQPGSFPYQDEVRSFLPSPARPGPAGAGR